MPSCENTYDRELAQIDALRQSEPELTKLAEFYSALLRAQAEVRQTFRPDAESVDVEAGRQRITEGEPFLAPEDVKPDWDAFDQLFDRVGEITRTLAELPDSGEACPSASGCSREWHAALLKAVLQGEACPDACAEDVGMDPGALEFVARQTLTPFLEAYAEQLRDHIDDAAWLRRSCPLCGGEPLMGKLAPETGKRLLQCHLCRIEWEAKRIECPFCGNEDQQRLRFFSDDEDPDHRVEVCDVCKRYLKVVDLRKGWRDVSLVAEHLATLHLDVVAEREGFRRESARLIGV